MSVAAPLPKANASKKRAREGDCNLCGYGMLLTPDLHETLVATAKKSITEPYKLPLDSFAADPEDIKDSGCARCLMVAVTCPNCKEYVAPKAVAAHFASKSHLRKTFERDTTVRRIAYTETLLDTATYDVGLIYARKRNSIPSPASRPGGGASSSLENGRRQRTATMDDDGSGHEDGHDDEEINSGHLDGSIETEDDEEIELGSTIDGQHGERQNNAGPAAPPKKMTAYLEHALTLYRGCELGRFSQSTVTDMLLPALNVSFGSLDPNSKEKRFTYYRQLVATFPKEMVMESTAFNLGLVRAQGPPNLPRGVTAKDRTIREALPETIKQDLGERQPLKIRSYRWLDNVGGLAHVRLNRFSPSENPRNQARTVFRLGESKEDLCLTGIISYQLTRRAAETIVWISYLRMEEKDNCILPVPDQEPTTIRLLPEPFFIGEIAYSYATVDPPLKDADPPGPFIPKFSVPKEYIKALA